jgi:hypothetical protein
MGDWVKQLCELPLSYRHGHHTIVALLAPAAAHLEDRSGFLAAVTAWMQAHRYLIKEWWHYSEDKRSSGPYFSDHVGARYDPLVVGFLQADGSRCDETHHTDDVAACADFIYREASWVVHQQRVI